MSSPVARWNRVFAPVVALSIAVFSVVLFAISKDVSHRQERQLLKERASELVSQLTLSLSEIKPTLDSAGAATLAPDSKNAFARAATLSTIGGTTGVLVARQSGGGYRVIAAAGQVGAKVGSVVDPQVVVVLNRATTVRGNQVSGVVQSGGDKHVIIAETVPGARNRVVYFDSLVSTAPAPADENSAFHELNVAAYAGASVNRDQLALVSGGVPKSGEPAVTKPFKVGVDTWTLQISAKTPLVGSLATLFPWLVLLAGLATAVFMGALIETLVRRRAYALRLVDERTRLLVDAQQAAERANNAKSEFLSRMSHELRTPLNAVLGFAQLLDMGELDADQTENVHQITKGGAHLLDLINEILDISQIESGRLSMSPEPVLVSEVIQTAISMVGPLAADKAVNVIATTDREPDRFVFADQQRLKQILLNLLSNGIKYNRHGGSVSVSCFEPSPGRLRIQVTDTGPGIPADKRDLLFTPFERLGAEQTLIEGTGVGLALSRGLATAMGGRLEVDSSEGRGSTFWLELPLVEHPEHKLDQVEDEPVVEESPGRRLVLHIEDNPANVSLVERVLAQRPDLEVVAMMQGRTGLDVARHDLPALILLDLNLPDMSGVEILKELRADPRTSGIPVIVISADAMPRQMQLLLSAGAAAYLTKPIDIRELLNKVDELLFGAAAEA